MIRAFLSTWSLVGSEVHNPIVDYIDVQPPMGIVCNMFYPDSNVDGLPDKAFLMVVMRSETHDISALAEDVGALPGVKLIPPYRLDTPMSSLNTPAKNVIRNVLLQYGLPDTLVDTSNTIGDLLLMILANISAGHKMPYAGLIAEYG